MLFRRAHFIDAFHRALRAAIAAHRPNTLRSLLAAHGERAFANGLENLPGRIIADALSMLPTPDRARVLRRLPRAARKRLREPEDSHQRDPLSARKVASCSSLSLLPLP